jgi:DNA-binding transcriptional regulator YhcF (GntR family)
MEFRQNEPIYLQIASYIADHILMRKWEGDQKIPSVRDLAILLQVNPNTVMRAYEYLENLKVIFNRRGIGFFVGLEGAAILIQRKKEIFLSQELPEFYSKLYSMNLEIKDLEPGYEEYKRLQLEKLKS